MPTIRMRMLTVLLPTVLLLATLAGRAGAVELSNTTPLTVPSDSGCCSAQVASSYPSSIDVSGLNGITTKVAVTLHEVSDTNGEDLAVLLVGPSGHGVVLMASYERGRHQRFDDATWIFETFAQPIACSAPEGIFPSGNTFAPFDCGLPDPFPAPAPLGPYGGMLEALGNNGIWSLYVDNQQGGEEGWIAGGWSLQIGVQSLGSGTPYQPPELPWANQSGNEAAARTVQEQREKEQEEQKAREAASNATEEAAALKRRLEEAAALKRRLEEAAEQAAARLKEQPACVVPALKGDTLAAARRALAAAHCRLGALYRPTRHDGTLRVSRQSLRAGKRLPDGARVALWISARSNGK